MSMISARCDELRAMSESVGLAMPQAATLMMEAADTIWELRCKLAGMVDMRERARLAEVENAKLQAENAKLRELVQDIYEVMWACTEQRCTHRHEGCFRVRGNHGDICVSERCWYEDRMSELGIEV